MKSVGRKECKPIQSLNEQAVRKKTKKIISDSQQLLCVPLGKYNQIKLPFAPASIKLMNNVHRILCNKKGWHISIYHIK